MESLWLLVVLFLFLLLIIPQVFKFYVAYNLLENKGLIILKLWFFNILYFSFQIRPSGIIVRTRKKRKQIEYAFNDPTIKFYEDFSRQLQQKLKVKYIDLYSCIGTGNAAQSAMLGGMFNAFYNSLGAKIKSTKKSCTVVINSHTNFNKQAFEVSVFSNLSIPLFDFLYCLVMAYLGKS